MDEGGKGLMAAKKKLAAQLAGQQRGFNLEWSKVFE